MSDERSEPEHMIVVPVNRHDADAVISVELVSDPDDHEPTHIIIAGRTPPTPGAVAIAFYSPEALNQLIWTLQRHAEILWPGSQAATVSTVFPPPGAVDGAGQPITGFALRFGAGDGGLRMFAPLSTRREVFAIIHAMTTAAEIAFPGYSSDA